MAIESVNGAGSAQQLQQLATPTANERSAEVAIERQEEEDTVEISAEARAALDADDAAAATENAATDSPVEDSEESAQTEERQEETTQDQGSGGDVNDLAALVNSGQGTNRGDLINTQV